MNVLFLSWKSDIVLKFTQSIVESILKLDEVYQEDCCVIGESMTGELLRDYRLIVSSEVQHLHELRAVFEELSNRV